MNSKIGMGSRIDLKSRILKLLKEDEEFKYAVAGLIGLEDLRRGQAELRDAIMRLTEGQRKLEEAVAEPANEQRNMWRALRYAIQGVSILLEDEARSMIELRLRQRGIEIRHFQHNVRRGRWPEQGDRRCRRKPRHWVRPWTRPSSSS
jgi:hypothetical protein